jgi:hypothetical protein
MSETINILEFTINPGVVDLKTGVAKGVRLTAPAGTTPAELKRTIAGLRDLRIFADRAGRRGISVPTCTCWLPALPARSSWNFSRVTPAG